MKCHDLSDLDYGYKDCQFLLCICIRELQFFYTNETIPFGCQIQVLSILLLRPQVLVSDGSEHLIWAP